MIDHVDGKNLHFIYYSKQQMKLVNTEMEEDQIKGHNRGANKWGFPFYSYTQIKTKLNKL